ncbi:hypothetical protein M8J76_014019 [Diaphorina citri]|nr:hypothetical protein M8J76_014019 [Diaphorina citri]
MHICTIKIEKRRKMYHHCKSTLLLSLLITIVSCDSDQATTDNKSDDTNDLNFVDKKLDEINKKTDQVKGFIDDIPKFLQSIHDIEKAEKEIADKIGADEDKIKAAQGAGRRKRNASPENDNMAGESFKADNTNVMSKDELVNHSIDYINNTLPEVKLKLVNILETYLKANTTKHPSSTSLPYENDSDFVFPNIVPQSTLSATLHKYNISLQNEKRELLNLENVILKMQNIVEAALLEIYKLEDSLTDDTVPHYTAAL